jgi:hypothetical protein
MYLLDIWTEGPLLGGLFCISFCGWVWPIISDGGPESHLETNVNQPLQSNLTYSITQIGSNNGDKFSTLWQERRALLIAIENSPLKHYT